MDGLDGWSADWLTCQSLFLFPEPCHECCHQHGWLELNKSINFISAQYKCKSHKTTCACIVFLFCVSRPSSRSRHYNHTALSQRPFEFPIRRERESVRIERRSWCPTCVRTCADTCTPMCLVTLFHQLAMTTLLARALRPPAPTAIPNDWTGLAVFHSLFCFSPVFCFFWYPKSLLCVGTHIGAKPRMSYVRNILTNNCKRAPSTHKEISQMGILSKQPQWIRHLTYISTK